MPRCGGATIAGAQQLVKSSEDPQPMRSMELLALVFSLFYMYQTKTFVLSVRLEEDALLI